MGVVGAENNFRKTRLKMDLFDKHGGYRKLDSFTLATIIQLGTWRFCERFLDRRNDPTGRQFDQMTQAARSGRLNLAEGSERAATSKEAEMKLTDVARASLAELKGDFEFWLLRRGVLPWKASSPEAKEVYQVRLDPNPLGDGDGLHEAGAYVLAQYAKFARWLDAEDPDRAANAMLVLISRMLNMLNRQLASQGAAFLAKGGFRERLTAARLEERGKVEGGTVPVCPECGKPMRQRKARSGRNAGKMFWGCADYPRCRGVLPVGSDGRG